MNRQAYLANELETFPRANVPFPTLFNFGEYPWFDECPTSNHDPIYIGAIDLFPIVLGGETITSAENGDGVY